MKTLFEEISDLLEFQDVTGEFSNNGASTLYRVVVTHNDVDIIYEYSGRTIFTDLSEAKLAYKDACQNPDMFDVELQRDENGSGYWMPIIVDLNENKNKKKRRHPLNKPFRTPGGPKKFGVYVKNDKGNVVLVRFGDPNMKIKRHLENHRKSFRARHHCDDPGPKWKARYWSCYQWRRDKKVEG